MSRTLEVRSLLKDLMAHGGRVVPQKRWCLMFDVGMLDIQHSTLDAQCSTLDTWHLMLDARHSTLDTRRLMLDAWHSMLDARHSTLDTWHSTLDTQQSMLNAQHSTLNTQHSTLSDVDDLSKTWKKINKYKNKKKESNIYDFIMWRMKEFKRDQTLSDRKLLEWKSLIISWGIHWAGKSLSRVGHFLRVLFPCYFTQNYLNSFSEFFIAVNPER
jgi:hypothetical protein